MLENSKISLSPGATIGILGGGQLGRMSALAAARLGFRCHIFTPENNSPASHVAFKTTIADYEDRDALCSFANESDVITYEFENIPIETALFLEQLKPVYPSPSILAISQHRGSEKKFANDHGIKVAPYELVTNYTELERALAKLQTPSILKTCRFGYDGKGQEKLSDLNSAKKAWKKLATQDAILEQFVEFEKEISVIIARNNNGALKAYPPVENQHENHILAITLAPANINEATSKQALEIAQTLAEALDLIGILAIEMFVLPNGQVVMNELAPRPHNSGHWSQDGAVTCQFEQFIRAISGQCLGSTKLIKTTKMVNLIGDAVNDWPKYLSTPNAKVHLYGKEKTKPGRKMGHVNFID